MLEDVIRLYETYLVEFHRQDQKRNLMEGAFGMGGGPRDYSCHEEFAQGLAALLENLATQKLASEETERVLQYIYYIAPVQWEAETSVYWMLLAVQGFTVKLVGQLDAATAKNLSDEYSRLYPRYQRLPVQDKVLSVLKRQSGIC